MIRPVVERQNSGGDDRLSTLSLGLSCPPPALQPSGSPADLVDPGARNTPRDLPGIRPVVEQQNSGADDRLSHLSDWQDCVQANGASAGAVGRAIAPRRRHGNPAHVHGRGRRRGRRGVRASGRRRESWAQNYTVWFHFAEVLNPNHGGFFDQKREKERNRNLNRTPRTYPGAPRSSPRPPAA